jgi:hypothetical protein
LTENLLDLTDSGDQLVPGQLMVWTSRPVITRFAASYSGLPTGKAIASASSRSYARAPLESAPIPVRLARELVVAAVTWHRATSPGRVEPPLRGDRNKISKKFFKFGYVIDLAQDQQTRYRMLNHSKSAYGPDIPDAAAVRDQRSVLNA